MTAEEVIAAGLERRIGSLPLGTRLRLILDQPIVDPTTHRLMPGPHLAGYVERLTPGAVQIKLVSTEAGRTARALLEDQLSSSTSCCRAIRSGSSPTISTTSDRRSSSRGRQGVTCGRRCRWTA